MFAHPTCPLQVGIPVTDVDIIVNMVNVMIPKEGLQRFYDKGRRVVFGK